MSKGQPEDASNEIIKGLISRGAKVFDLGVEIKEIKSPTCWTAEDVRGLSAEVYRLRIGKDNAAGIIVTRGEDAFREMAGQLDALTRCYLKVAGCLLEEEQE